MSLFNDSLVEYLPSGVSSAMRRLTHNMPPFFVFRAVSAPCLGQDANERLMRHSLKRKKRFDLEKESPTGIEPATCRIRLRRCFSVFENRSLPLYC